MMFNAGLPTTDKRFACVKMDKNGEWLSEALYPVFHFRKWHGVQFEGLHGAMGYMSEILRAYPNWEGEHLPESIIIKIATFSMKAEKAINIPVDNDEANTAQMTTLIKIFHRNESKLYELFQQLDSPPVCVPRVYFIHNNGGLRNEQFPVIVMEDLGKYSVVDIVDGFNDKQMYAIVDAIVDLHVYSFTNTGWELLGFTSEELEETGSMAAIVGVLADRLKKTSPYHFGSLDLLMKLCGEGDWHKRYILSCRNGEILTALVHGDLWSANMMWEDDTLMAIIDWQLAHRGSITEDIMRVLCTCVNVETRKRLTKPLFTYYYKQLKNRLSKVGQTIEFTFEDVEESYRSTLMFTALSTVFAAAFWSNSAVLKDETNPFNEASRIKEIFDRTKSIIEEAVENTISPC